MLTYEDLFALSVEASLQIVGKPLTRFELVHPRIYQLFFERVPLLLSLKAGAVRFHLLKNALSSILDPFSNFFQKKLQGQVCETVALLNEDRLLEFRFNNGMRLIAALFPKKPNLYLVNQEGMIESSLFPIKDPHFNPPHKPERKKEHTPSSITSAALELQFAKQEALHQLKQALDKARQTLRTLQLEREKCQTWEQGYHEGILLQSHFHLIKKGLSEIELSDWESGQNRTITLDPHKTAQENIEERFKRAKKQQAGLERIIEGIEKQTAKIQVLENKLQELSEATALESLPQPVPKKPKIAPQKGLPYEEFHSQSGLPIWVGKGASKNDLLTFRYAKGSDWWLHVQGYPGSHVVIRTSKHTPPDEEALQDALTLAIFHSKAQGEKHVEVLVTQRKFVSKLGKAGQVQVSSHKLLHSQVDPARLRRLRQKNLPYP